MDALIRMALAHCQFEASHPFDDGNGGTGRVLNVLMLVAAGLFSQPILYLSRYIINNKNWRSSALLAVTAEGARAEWIRFKSEGVRQTSLSTLAKVGRVQDLQQEMKQEIAATGPSSGHIALLDVLFEQPYCRISNVISACNVSRPAATKRVKSLAERGAPIEIQVGRELQFINRGFMDLLVTDTPT